MRLVEFTRDLSDEPVLINPEQVVAVYPGRRNHDAEIPAACHIRTTYSEWDLVIIGTLNEVRAKLCPPVDIPPVTKLEEGTSKQALDGFRVGYVPPA